MGKKCDLCDGVARMYCESDEASLCWACDGKVHGANFLVAKHMRCLLCSACQSPTPWKATGLRLGPTFSVCDSCVALKSSAAGGRGGDQIPTENPGQEINGFEEDSLRDNDGDGAESYDDDEDEDEDEEYSDEDADEDEEDVDDEEAENQVVPWSAAAAAQPPPMMMSSSSSDGGGGDPVAKRTRDFSEIGCSSAQESNYSRPLKRPSRDEHAFRSTAVINSLVRLEGERTLKGAVDSAPSSSSSLIFAISKTRRDLSR